MVWQIDQEPVNGIMFRGQSRVRVLHPKSGARGYARVEYHPTCRVVGPVVGEVEYDGEGFPTTEPEVIDPRPSFR